MEASTTTPNPFPASTTRRRFTNSALRTAGCEPCYLTRLGNSARLTNLPMSVCAISGKESRCLTKAGQEPKSIHKIHRRNPMQEELANAIANIRGSLKKLPLPIAQGTVVKLASSDWIGVVAGHLTAPKADCPWICVVFWARNGNEIAESSEDVEYSFHPIDELEALPDQPPNQSNTILAIPIHPYSQSMNLSQIQAGIILRFGGGSERSSGRRSKLRRCCRWIQPSFRVQRLMKPSGSICGKSMPKRSQ